MAFADLDDLMALAEALVVPWSGRVSRAPAAGRLGVLERDVTKLESGQAPFRASRTTTAGSASGQGSAY